MSHLYLECAYGLGGDMLLAGLAALGVDLAPLVDILGADLLVSVEARDERRNGLVGARLHYEHAPGQPLRRMPEINAVLDGLQVSDSVREKTRRAFERMAEVEAAAHGISLEKVHFHELGAVDTLMDVLGAFWALEQLGVERVTAAPLPWFRGEIDCEHGRLTLPAPATARLLEGKPVYPTQHDTELITPTGALLLDQLVEEYADGPQGTLLKTGVAYGTRDVGGGVRLFLFEPESDGDERLETDEVMVLTSNIDHLTGEELGGVFQPLLDAGALDVLFLPGLMKKNRPGGQLQVMCAPEDLPVVQDAFFRQTLSLGIRRTKVERALLPRRGAEVVFPHGDETLPAKEFDLHGETYTSAEFDALKEFAQKSGRSVAELRYLLHKK